MTSHRPNVGHLFIHTQRRGASSLVLSRDACLQNHSGSFGGQNINQKNLGSIGQSYTLFYWHRTAIVIITTLVLSPFPTAFPEHKQSCRNFQTWSQFAHYRIVSFRSVHSLKTTSSKDCETLWLEGSICEEALWFWMMVDCVGFKDDVIWAGVTWSFCFYCGQWGKIWGYIPQEGKLLMSMHRFFSKPETPVCGQDKPEGMMK